MGITNFCGVDIYVGPCFSCGEPINDTNPPGQENFLWLKNKGAICEQCGLDLIEPIYRLGCGGLTHLTFRFCLTSSFNRRRRKRPSHSPKWYEKILKELMPRYNFRCAHCGTAEQAKLTIDHIVPVSKGGQDLLSNLQILCKSCNSKKGTKPNKACAKGKSNGE